jgi:hypothetical protein
MFTYQNRPQPQRNILNFRHLRHNQLLIRNTLAQQGNGKA